jgi:predicted ATPase with chaperone activity
VVVEVEVDFGNGLPGINIVGMPDTISRAQGTLTFPANFQLSKWSQMA